MVRGIGGDYLRPVALIPFGNGSPQPRAQRLGAMDDGALATQHRVVLALCRLTLFRDVALPAVVAKAMRDPQRLPSLMLCFVMQRRVISTEAAISYAHEVAFSYRRG